MHGRTEGRGRHNRLTTSASKGGLGRHDSRRKNHIPNLLNRRTQLAPDSDNNRICGFFQVGKLGGEHLRLQEVVLTVLHARKNQFLVTFQIHPYEFDPTGERFPVLLFEGEAG